MICDDVQEHHTWLNEVEIVLLVIKQDLSSTNDSISYDVI